MVLDHVTLFEFHLDDAQISRPLSGAIASDDAEPRPSEPDETTDEEPVVSTTSEQTGGSGGGMVRKLGAALAIVGLVLAVRTLVRRRGGSDDDGGIEQPDAEPATPTDDAEAAAEP